MEGNYLGGVSKLRFDFKIMNMYIQGVKLTFFSDSHLAPKFFKVVANSKNVGRHFQREKIFNVLQSGH